ncbi:methyltransferase domain-containing protein, partial [Patescibacteria group bacterium]|nr:methyltransferase domain-containing protein [Patescibacteria group bacterium]
MSFDYKFRDFFLSRMDVLKEVGIKPGFHLLDYGCGPGSYIIAAVELVGKSGKIYALDIHPLAIQRVQSITSKRQLTNVKTICSDCKTGLPNDSIDVILLYDIFHELNNPNAVLEELH